MKKILLFILMMWGIAHGQTTYSIRADSTKLEKVGGNNELILLNSTKNVPGFLYNKGNGRTEFKLIAPLIDTQLAKYSFLKYVQAPLILANDSTIELIQAGLGSDGYLSALDWARFDSAASMWKDTLFSLPAIVPKSNKMLFAKQYLLGPSSAISFYNTAWDINPYPVFWAGPINQNVLIGSRGGATRYLAGTFTGTQNVAVGEFALGSATTAGNNVAVGRSAGFNITTGTGNILIGFNRTSTTTATNTLDIGGWITGQSGWISIGTGNPLQKLHVKGKLQVDTLSNSTDKDSVLSVDGGQITKRPLSANTYSPTLGNTINISSISIGHITYRRTDDRVNVEGYLTLTPTAPAVSTSFTMSLPFASAFTSATDAGGLFTVATGSTGGNVITADLTNDVAAFNYIPITNTETIIGFSYSYQIK